MVVHMYSAMVTLSYGCTQLWLYTCTWYAHHLHHDYACVYRETRVRSQVLITHYSNMSVSTYAVQGTHISIHAYMHVHTRAHTHVHTCTYSVSMNVLTHTHMYPRTHTFTCMNTCCLIDYISTLIGMYCLLEATSPTLLLSICYICQQNRTLMVYK